MNNNKTVEELQADLDAIILEKEVLIAGNNLIAKKRAVEDKRAMTALSDKDRQIMTLQAQIASMEEPA